MKRTHTRFTHRLSKLVVTPIRLSLLLAVMLAAPAHSETVGTPAADSDAIKYEAIELVNRLYRLERELLYPVHTQVSVFLSVADNSRVQPHSVSIAIDGGKVTDHLYTQKEIDALNTGGIQRLYTGNIPLGNHKLRVSFRQSRKDGSVQADTVDYKFNKDETAENIEIIVDNRKPPIAIKSRN